MKRFILDIFLINAVTMTGVYLANKYVDFITIRGVAEYLFAQIGLLGFYGHFNIFNPLHGQCC